MKAGQFRRTAVLLTAAQLCPSFVWRLQLGEGAPGEDRLYARWHARGRRAAAPSSDSGRGCPQQRMKQGAVDHLSGRRASWISQNSMVSDTCTAGRGQTTAPRRPWWRCDGGERESTGGLNLTARAEKFSVSHRRLARPADLAGRDQRLPARIAGSTDVHGGPSKARNTWALSQSITSSVMAPNFCGLHYPRYAQVRCCACARQYRRSISASLRAGSAPPSLGPPRWRPASARRCGRSGRDRR